VITKQKKANDVAYDLAHELMIHLSEDIFGDDVPGDCEAMLACGWEVSLISSASNK